MSWDKYKSTAAKVSGPPEDSQQKKVIPPKPDFYSHQSPALLPPKESRDLPTLIQAVREIEAEKQAERRRIKEEKKHRRTAADVIQEEEVRVAVKEEVEREL